MEEKEYKCGSCGEIFEKGWSDEEALAEAASTFGKKVKDWESPSVVICDDCYQKMFPANHPEKVEKAKQNI